MAETRNSPADLKGPLLGARTSYWLPDGAAAHSLNHVLGCSHGCTYPCAALMSAIRFKKVRSREEWLEARIGADVIDRLRRNLDASRRRPVERVLMCPSTDPFMHGRDDVAELSLACLREINSHGIPATVLTKGLLPHPSALIGHPGNEFGISLASLDEGYRERTEPGAAPYEGRIAALREAHEAGLRTWVAIEPFPIPPQMGTLQEKRHATDILKRVAFADRAVLGTFRHMGDVGSWRQWHVDESRAAEAFCKERGMGFHLTDAMTRLLDRNKTGDQGGDADRKEKS